MATAPIPPAKPVWNQMTYRLPQDMYWVWICLKGCGCRAVQAQFFLNPCTYGEGTALLDNPLCASGNAQFLIPSPSCDDVTDTCNYIWLPWYNVCKWSPIDADLPCGSPAPSSIPCTPPT